VGFVQEINIKDVILDLHYTQDVSKLASVLQMFVITIIGHPRQKVRGLYFFQRIVTFSCTTYKINFVTETQPVSQEPSLNYYFRSFHFVKI
jgi:hypothetical protein